MKKIIRLRRRLVKKKELPSYLLLWPQPYLFEYDAGHEDDYVTELAEEVRKVLESLEEKPGANLISPSSPSKPFAHLLPLQETAVAAD